MKKSKVLRKSERELRNVAYLCGVLHFKSADIPAIVSGLFLSVIKICGFVPPCWNANAPTADLGVVQRERRSRFSLPIIH
jgi:hypothetical protein